MPLGSKQQSLKSELLSSSLPLPVSGRRDLSHICTLTSRGCRCTSVSYPGQKPQQSAGMGLTDPSLSQSVGIQRFAFGSFPANCLTAGLWIDNSPMCLSHPQTRNFQIPAKLSITHRHLVWMGRHCLKCHVQSSC